MSRLSIPYTLKIFLKISGSTINTYDFNLKTQRCQAITDISICKCMWLIIFRHKVKEHFR